MSRGVDGADGAWSLYHEAETELALHVYPSHLADVTRAMADRLSRLLMRYNEDLGGVPITFSEMRLANPTGRIFQDHPHVHLRVLANFVVFAPAVGKPLSGTVTLMGPDHIGLLVNGVFNASIPASKIPPAFVANAEAGEANRLVHATTGQVIEAGAAITFMVTALETVNAILTISGSLLPEDGAVDINVGTPARKAAARPKVPMPRLNSKPPQVRAEKRRGPDEDEDEDGAGEAARDTPPAKSRRRSVLPALP